MGTIFVSPGVYTKEQDFSVFASRIGITRLGLVGKTEKGPAFEAIKVSSTDEYLLRFGGTKPELPLSYVANYFLSQANDLTISRVLGSGGFTNSPAWLITADNLVDTFTYTGATTVSGVNYTGETTVSGATLTAPILSTGATTYTIAFASVSTMAAGTASATTAVNNSIVINYSACTMNMIQTAMTIDARWAAFGVTMTGGDNISNIINNTGITFTTVALPYQTSFTAPVLTTGITTYTMTFTSTPMAAGTASASTVVGGNAITINYSACTMDAIKTAMAIDSNWNTFGVLMTSVNNIRNVVNTAITITTVAVPSESGTVYSGATLAILRSKKDSSNGLFFDEETDVQIITSGMVNPLSDFVISATTGPLTAYTKGLSVSLDETKDNYIVKVFGKNPKEISGAINLYVEEIYPNFIREAVGRNLLTGPIYNSLVYKTDDAYTDYTSDYAHSITPWIVSRVIGNEVHRLFRFHTISDGDSSAKEIKVSIANLDIINYTFDVIVRRFEDTDATAGQTALERYSNVTLNENEPNFIGKIIGTWDEEYPSKSMFITVELATRYPENSIPAGFEGYELRGTEETYGSIPDIFYKTTYFSGDSTFKTYLGVSELGYTSLTSSSYGISVKNSVKAIEKDLFVYHGSATSAITKTKGFHLENTADSTKFVSGDKNTLSAYTKSLGSTITDKAKLKFTLVPVGGFDGFNKYKSYENPCDEFREESEQTNVEKFKEAINVFSNPEETDINLLATPGVDYLNNTEIVKYALEMVEDRTDTLYIIDAPRLAEISNGETQRGTPEQAVSDLESTGIDSSYSATYWPWIQIEDSSSGKYTYQAPTLLVVKTLALTDNVSAPWFAPAGINRATAGTSVKRTDVKLSKDQRDTLYAGRINPIASFVQQGIVIWGQKTMQVRQSALDRINIRRLLLQVRRLISAASLTLVFEQNDQTLRDQFLSRVEPILLQIQNQRGLTAFKVVMDDSNNTSETIDRNTLIGKIQIKPTRTAEFISLDFQVLPTGAAFSDF